MNLPLLHAGMDVIIRETLRRGRRADLFRFVQGSFDVLHGSATLFEENWHIGAMCHELTRTMRGENRHLLITLPPRHLKTICASVCFPAFILGHNPDAKIIITTYSGELSEEIGRKIRQLMSSSFYKALFPGVSFSSSGPILSITGRSGFVRVTSTGGSITGFGGDYIIIDDPIKPADAQSEVERQSCRDYFSGTLLSRLNSKSQGRLIAVMQRVHEEDLAAHLLSLGSFRHLNLPAIAVENERIAISDTGFHERFKGDVLFPQSESRETLSVMRNAMGRSVFEAQYQQNPVAEGGGTLDWSIFKSFDEVIDRDRFCFVIQSWDTALSEEPTADYSACTTWGCLDAGWYLLDVVRERLSYNALKHLVLAQNRKWSPDRILIEKTGSGVPLSTELIREERLGRSLIIPMIPRLDKRVRFEAAVSRIKDGQFFVPEKAPWLAGFRSECQSFPGGRHDDMVDSMSQFLAFLGERRAQALLEGGRRPQGCRPSGREHRRR